MGNICTKQEVEPVEDEVKKEWTPAKRREYTILCHSITVDQARVGYLSNKGRKSSRKN